MRVFVLAIDGLHYDYVLKRDLESLKQVSYSRTDLSDIPRQDRKTPTLWASFISGKTPRVHGLKTWRSFQLPLVDWLSSRIEFLRQSVFWRTLNALGFSGRGSSLKDRDTTTVFDHASKSIVISLPGWNLDPRYIERINIYQSIREPTTRAKATAFIEKMYEKKIEELWRRLDDSWHLFVIHIWKVDILNHLYHRDQTVITTLYEEMNELASQLKERLPDSLLLVVSDHGTWRGLHTDHGFCSVNIETELKNPRITGFYDLIRGWLHNEI